MRVSILKCNRPHNSKAGTGYAIWSRIVPMLALTLLGFAQAFSQSASLDQIRNGSATAPVTPSDWVNGNAGPSNAHFAEGYSIPYRMRISSLVGTPATVHTLIIEWDTKDQNGHALDYITHYDNIDNPLGSHQANFGHTKEVIDPTIGTTFSGSPSLFQIPAPSSTGAEVTGMPTTSFNNLPTAGYTNNPNATKMAIWGGTITGMTYLNQDPQDATTASTKTQLSITFKSADGSTALIAWGGHIAAEYDWGLGRGASKVNGSPYHTRLISIDGKGGNQDRSLKASAVFVPPPACSLTAAQTACEGSTTTLTYQYTGSTSGITNYSWTLAPGTTGAKISGASGNTVSGANLTSVNIVPTDAATGYTRGATPTFTLTLTTTNLGGTTSCQTTGTINPKAVADAGADLTRCQSTTAQSVSLTGSSVSGGATSGTWSIVSSNPANAGNTLSNNTLAAGTLSVAANYVGVITVRLTTNDPDGPCGAVSDDRLVTIYEAATANAGADQTVCSSSPTVTLNGSVGGGATSGSWSGGTGTFNPDANTLSATYTPSAAEIAAGTVTLTLTTNDPAGPCGAVSDAMTITISPQPSQPTAAVKTPLCTDATMTVEVTLPSGLSSSATVTLTQMPGGASPITKNASDAVGGKLTFTGLTFGKGYSITITDNKTTANPSGCTSVPLECGDFSGGPQNTVMQAKNTLTEQEVVLKNKRLPSVLAAPNPFNDRIRFLLKSEVSGQGVLELYNSLGQKVKTVFQGNVVAGQTQTVEYSVPGPQRGNLIYVFRVGEQQTTGKLIGLK